jgi:hypothetical protein
MFIEYQTAIVKGIEEYELLPVSWTPS